MHSLTGDSARDLAGGSAKVFPQPTDADIRTHLAYATRRAQKYAALHGLDPDHIVSDAAFGVARALDSFRPGCGRSFGSHCYAMVGYELAEGGRRQCWANTHSKRNLVNPKRPISLDALLAGFDDENTEYKTGPFLVDGDYESIRSHIFVQQLFETLPAKLRVVARLRFVDGLLLREIAVRLGISKTRSTQLVREAAQALKNAWQK